MRASIGAIKDSDLYKNSQSENKEFHMKSLLKSTRFVEDFLGKSMDPCEAKYRDLLPSCNIQNIDTFPFDIKGIQSETINTYTHPLARMVEAHLQYLTREDSATGKFEE